MAMGRVRLSFNDFCLLTPDEFEAICKAWQDTYDAGYREDWERTRVLAAITIQPHVKQRITPQKLLPFAWDRQVEREQRQQRHDAPAMTAAERRARAMYMLKKLGSTM